MIGLLFTFTLVQFPIFISIYFIELGIYIWVILFKKLKKKTILPLSSCKMTFSPCFSWIIYIKVWFYTPRYLAFCTICNFLKIKQKKNKTKIIIFFILTRIWVYITGIPIITFKLTFIWKEIFWYVWVNYDSEVFGLWLIDKFNSRFK